MMTSKQIRQAFTDYWTSAPRNAKEVPNVSLVPNNDPTLLFVNSGMFPINPYLAGQPHPLGTRIFNFQRCLRTLYEDMLEIGDNRHTLMFEMMGDWSFGDFTKKDQIPWMFSFWVDILGLDPKRIYVSVFEGNDAAPRDDEAIAIWTEIFKRYGVEAELCSDISNLPKDLKEGENWKYHIYPYGKKNWWQRAADAPGELGGPSSEVFYDRGVIEVKQDKYHINDDSGRFIEIGNNVFMEYRFEDDGKWHPMEQKNIDFGGGFERTVMAVQDKKDIFETDVYSPVLEAIAAISGREYRTNGQDNEWTRFFRILADHSRAATFILADGVFPSNKDQGYILRRFIRRLVRYGTKIGLKGLFTANLAQAVIDAMSYAYPHLKEQEAKINEEMTKEEVKFGRTLANGLKELQKIKNLNGKNAFYIYESFGFPLEMSLEELGVAPDNAVEIEKEFKAEETVHRMNSRAGAEMKFKGGLADQSKETTKLHTAHHLLLAALQQLISPNIRQRGSNITGERLRIDFNYDQKLTEEQIKKIENLVNEKIQEKLSVVRKEMPKADAEKLGAQQEFGQKYPDVVSVYFIGGNEENGVVKDYFSAEFCGGPHVSNTIELGGNNAVFHIQKEESSGAGLRRIKAELRTVR